MKLSSALTKPVVDSGRVIAKVVLDLTVYLERPSEDELDFLFGVYERVCPAERLKKYTIAELPFWCPLAHPELTASGRAAQAAGVARPYFEPARQRIRDGRGFEVGYWDGRSIDDPEGSWVLSCRRIHLRDSGLHAFVRMMIPLESDPLLLKTVSGEIADHVAFSSGHGGLVFLYDPWHKPKALDAVYALARRFWGVDIEDLNRTLPLMNDRIKGVNWLTLVGRRLLGSGAMVNALEALPSGPSIVIEPRRTGVVITAGPEPVPGDQHRPDASLDPYVAVATALRPLFLDSHPDFTSERFVTNGSTIGWVRRFLEPSGWR
jgi:hypothetical protein